MKRRDALKALAISAVAVSSLSAYDEKLIVNKQDMVVKDPKNPTDFEAKHLPAIHIGNKDEKGYTLVEITVGQLGIIHPSEANHWIYKIDLYADDKLVSVVNLEPVISRGYLSARVKLDDVKVLKSTAFCNLHGNFTATLYL
ncbi:desulfoferrodoxin [Campylobacter blaseri]|uniref:Twin-arginine translocation pathway signal protein n=1 Tax=Campylobacter blaseri TaxID=2042961 RepID=A0A2P8QZV1_9BACT|nr:desulfoferrodoxin family protein [Campylobacter blaseri]PSM51785.1 twin-arginine translocation pathway signal protein [Campylobacter blaseri]PSM53576.1 twin-arginine translocation pathway signal protein [Campylobacter blaseri]QKF86387.1 desulfoferrodoxin [Campylobacter blaseri]